MCAEFQLCMSNTFRDMRGPQFTLGALHPRTLPKGKFSCPDRVLGPVYMCVKFELSICNGFGDMMGFQIYPSVG